MRPNAVTDERDVEREYGMPVMKNGKTLEIDHIVSLELLLTRHMCTRGRSGQFRAKRSWYVRGQTASACPFPDA